MGFSEMWSGCGGWLSGEGGRRLGRGDHGEACGLAGPGEDGPLREVGPEVQRCRPVQSQGLHRHLLSGLGQSRGPSSLVGCGWWLVVGAAGLTLVPEEARRTARAKSKKRGPSAGARSR